ncbi:hypothetical protein OV079_05175 [Nannocystis pusilla]|uniref:Uncharacterized protein n=1 Tax=Nannocystis pusilla TaxID=889268 RepID=A0A9X3EJ11_9BACT|nr:hypothetical protein [Nannocystis pusilla]MCY1004972.1 hypothetical protein [Nannocystis pusilla]
MTAATIARLVREIGPAVYEQFQARLLFAVAVESTECWLLPLYYGDNHRKKTINCLRTLNEALKGQEGFSIDVNQKQVKYYRKIVKRLGKRKDVEAHARHNSSFGRFLASLEPLRSAAPEPTP